jgi:hypothetical protein
MPHRPIPPQYLLDSVEAKRGLADHAWFVANVLDKRAAALRPAAQAARVRYAIETQLWQPRARLGMFGWAADRLSSLWGELVSRRHRSTVAGLGSARPLSPAIGGVASVEGIHQRGNANNEGG